jgi:hypothetical protein
VEGELERLLKPLPTRSANVPQPWPVGRCSRLLPARLNDNSVDFNYKILAIAKTSSRCEQSQNAISVSDWASYSANTSLRALRLLKEPCGT